MQSTDLITYRIPIYKNIIFKVVKSVIFIPAEV